MPLCRNQKRAIPWLIFVTLIICVLLCTPRVTPVHSISSFYLPILMYHQLSENPVQWNSYVLSPTVFEDDIHTLIQNGYTPVSTQQIKSYVTKQQAPPKKPVLITFDDGDSSFYHLAWPIIKKLDLPVLLSPVASWVEQSSQDKSNHQHMTFEQIQEMVNTGLVEVGNHTYNLHKESSPRKGVLRHPGESMAQYRQQVIADIDKAQALWTQHLGQSPDVFTYPYGFCNDFSETVIQEMGFAFSITCHERINVVSNAQSLYALGRFNRPSGINSLTVVNKIDHLVENAWKTK